MQKTPMPKPEEVPSRWLLVDAQDKVLGRLASQVARILTGKNKPQFTRHLCVGDYVIVINADKITVTGQKTRQKIYYRYSGYPGGLKSIALGKLQQKNPERLFRDAVWGMLPKNRLGRRVLSHLHIYSGSSHQHKAQKPEVYQVK
ncbi:MAG: 50S ribosomal protein L13 [candidate division Zixibacteria bacterium RBG_16_50_21]|nr:MAG: 50S ribosomal protein L13 [candidate division Zixibacteria bacterium RBG_16_50_21]